MFSKFHLDRDQMLKIMTWYIGKDISHFFRISVYHCVGDRLSIEKNPMGWVLHSSITNKQEAQGPFLLTY